MNKVQDHGEPLTAEKVSYGILGLSRSLLSQVISLFMMYFYTDVFGIPVQFITVMLLIFSIWEGFSKQLVGFFMGKTQSKHGKYRPFILWTVVPYAAFAVAVFTAPDLSVPYKILYAYSIYFIWAVINNILSAAHNSILPLMSKNTLERTQINSLKLIFSVFASVVASSFTLNLVDMIGGGNQEKGFALTMLIMALISIPIQYFSFRNIKERHADAGKNKISFKFAVRCILDKRLILFFLIYCTFWMFCTFKNQATTYYMKYVLDQPDFTGTFFMIGTTSSFIMHFFIKRIVSYIKIETAMCIGILGSILAVFIMYAANGNILLLSSGNIVFGLMSAIPANLIYVILAGYVDEKNNLYKTSLGSWLYSSMDNLAKIGIGIGGAVFSGLLNIYGYEPNIAQTSSGLFGIKLGFFGGTAIAAFVCLILMGFYIIVCKKRQSSDKEMLSQA